MINIQYQAQVITDLNSCVTLHDGQKMIAKAIFIDGKKRVFAQLGRKAGKTTIMPYTSYRRCMSFPNSVVYIVAPFLNQAKELLWADHRMTHFLSDDLMKKYGVKLNNSEMRVSFENGSFIKLLGADNPESSRGVNPDMIIFDESKDISSTFFEGIEPNLAARNGVLLMVGTPPSTDQNLFCKMAKEIKNDPDGLFLQLPSWTNPHIDKEWFKKQKQRLIDRGEYDVWQREYEAKLVFGGHNSIFPMFSRKRHIIKYETILAEIRRYPKDYEYYYGFDPGSSLCFAGMSMVLNKKTKKVIFMDEIYEKRTLETSTGKIYPTAKMQMDIVQSYEDKWNIVYDSAALWFANEVANQFDRNIMPCEKDIKTKNDKISMIKDMMNYDFFYMTDRCPNFAMEIENYVMDEKGSTNKCADHLLDVARYNLNAANYDFTPDMTLISHNEDKRYYTMEEDKKNDVDDVYHNMFEYLYE